MRQGDRGTAPQGSGTEAVITRRRVLRLAAGGLVLTAAGACSSSGDGSVGSTAATAAAATPSDPSGTSGTGSTSPAPGGGATASTGFFEPTVLRSTDGRLDVTLVAAETMVPSGAGTRFATTYNGTTPGPTLVVRPGDVLTVTLENRLAEPTNLHTHGLHVSPGPGSDDVFVTVEPGRSHTYTYRLPADHHGGLFWYHPHHHGMVAAQLAGGMAGAVVVLDAVDADPTIRETTERLLILSDPPIGTGPRILSVPMMEQMQGREGDAVLVNGVEAPTIAGRTGRAERWRFLNASASRYYRLALEGHRLAVLATDGGRLAAPQSIEEVLLSPGERVELLVTPTAGIHRLQALPYDRGSFGMAGRPPSATRTVTVATFTVAADGAPPAPPTRLTEVRDLTTATVDARRELVLAMGGMGGAGGGGGMGGGMGGGGGMVTIDGRTFDPARLDRTARLGTTEEWTIRNTSPMDHPFHLHVWPFQVVARSDGAAVIPAWKDTVNVPANGWVRVRIPFVRFDGRTVYHCHILDHEDLGMMGTIEVTGTA